MAARAAAMGWRWGRSCRGSFFSAATAGARGAPIGHERRALSKGWRETGTFFSQSLAG
ncbi:hypothetical protein BURCENBC7_AP4575 [Burkholderia cenocepacia BC7]|nr:hypothetical protein BURCENBC7_AP4575 [Burkholderia cenocepacia BC7]